MNEVTKIHLGRQAYTISVDAHKALRVYLDAIKKQVGDKDVVEEVELRMAELLAEHGVSGDKVILPADVDYLKEQLGNPKDFKEEDGDSATEGKPAETKRLFRDTDNAMIAGVAAGLASYFGIDVLLIRILFVIAVITGGWGILLYIALWLLVPEAKSSSDRLQMAGRSVTVDSLKEVVERADIKGAAHRANNSVAGPINTFFRIIIKIIGLGFIVLGLAFVLALFGLGLYLLVHGNVVQDNLFPVGLRERLLVYIAYFVLTVMAIFVVLFGMAIFRRKWPIRSWLTGVLVGLSFIGLVVGGALAGDAAPKVRDRYRANFHTQARSVAPFTSITAVGEAVPVRVQLADHYYIGLRYYNGGNPAQVKTTVKNGALIIDYQHYIWDRHCPTLCIPNVYVMEVTVYTPNPTDIMYLPKPGIPDEPVFPGSQKFYQQ